MSFSPVYTCNGCSATKGEANHWLAIRHHGDGVFHVIDIRAFHDAATEDEHYCGEQCLMKAVSAFINDLRERQDDLAAERRAEEAESLSQVVVLDEPLTDGEPIMDAEYADVDEHTIVVRGGCNTCSNCGWPIVANPNTGCHEIIPGSGRVMCFDDKRQQPEVAYPHDTGEPGQWGWR